jgi:DNA modification methylase
MTIQLLTGDARDVLPTLPSNSVHCCVCSPPYYALRSYLDVSHPDKHRELGSEQSPDEYLANMVEVFREIRRVMRDDACAFVNMGDSYNSKQLLLMPARLALALQADGWWVRSDIIWAKPNPMPESCTDRPTSAHEHVFLLTKAARYFYDADAVREEGTGRDPGNNGHAYEHMGGAKGGLANIGPATSRNLRNVWTIATHAFPEAHFATYPPELVERCIRAGTSERGCCAACGAPWVRTTEKTFVPQPHVSLERGVRGALEQKPTYALAWDGVPRGTTSTTTTGWQPTCQCHGHFEDRPAAPDWISDETGERKMVPVYVPDEGAPPPVPCTVLDPFLGSGTTALVADRLQRHCIGIDLSLTYADMAQRRLEADCPLFTAYAPAEDPEDTRMADLFQDIAAD